LLERGQSRTGELVLCSGGPVVHVVVGSSSLCDWRIGAPGVRPRHFRLVWGRGRLRIEECWTGEVRVDGRPVGARLELPAAARLEFGDAVLQLEPIRPAPPTREARALLPARIGVG
jgi:hypothetical protein